MASTCEVWKAGIKLGAGTCAANSTSITSYTATLSRVCHRRNVEIMVTQAGTHVGRTWRTRVTNDNGSGTLTLADPCPYVGA